MTGTAGDAVAPADLIGAWQLESYVGVDEDGDVSEGPLGPEPEGVLIYSADRHMTVSMMRAGHEPAPGPGPVTRFMGYAGTWQLSERQIVHEVAVSSHRHMVGTRQVRGLSLKGDLLILSGTARTADGRQERRVLNWRRVSGG
ncbi:lipocalin-like domain-containing protein [Streptomyces sp. QH1-20]|uniref:lipocalin-like domain-containing protein n=1 Tax=Streptomyces sp. QH1-20 TaxID=3240934 RepID=UPI00351634DD